MKVLVTGAAGFIGMHSCTRLLARGDAVIGLDNLNDYYDPALKRARLAQLTPHSSFKFIAGDICDRNALRQVFEDHRPARVIHLAAQVGVRYSLNNPAAYIDSNLVGFANMLEECRRAGVEHLVYASSSSVYGGNTNLPFSEQDNVDHPVSLYAATKKANELMAHAYSHLYRLPVTGLRFFTVYGPWGRPDMAPMLFAKAILEGRAIDVFNHGDLKRDFTYVDDVADAVVRLCDKPAEASGSFDPARPDPSRSNAPYRIFNVGNSQPVQLLDFIGAIEKALGKTARKNFLPMQPGDVAATAADTDALAAWTGERPATPLAQGIAQFVHWYLDAYPQALKAQQ